MRVEKARMGNLQNIKTWVNKDYSLGLAGSSIDNRAKVREQKKGKCEECGVITPRRKKYCKPCSSIPRYY